jgi:hypothetical protein
MRTTAAIAWIASLGLGVSGCLTNRVVTHIQQHPNTNAIAIETLDTYLYYYVLYAQTKTVHQFWVCKDRGDTVECVRECGGKSDLDCPTKTVVQTSQGAQESSNVR